MSTSLPVIQRPLDNTALSAYMACPREYWLSMHLHRRGEGRSAAMAYGSLAHKIMEWHYKTDGAAPLVEAYVRAWHRDFGYEEEGDHRTLERGILDYKRYRAKWGQRPDNEQARTVGWPDQPMIEISANIYGDGLTYPWAGKIDRLIELGGLYYVEDHKTTSRLDRNYFKAFELSNQMKGYTWMAQQLMPSLNIVGVRMNVWHVLKDSTNFERQIITFTKEEIKEWVHNTDRWIRRIEQDILEWPTEEEVLSGEVELWPMGHFGDNGCSRKYGLCRYYDLCSIATPFRHRALAEIPVNPWDPMEVDD